MTMLFGTQAPKFVVGSTTTYLDNCKYTVTQETDYIEQTSIITGHKEFVVKGMHRVFDVIVYLYKSGSSDSDRAFYHLTLHGLRGQSGSFYQHRDGQADKNSSDTNISYTCVLVEDFYLTDAKFEDCVRLVFKSKDYVDTTKSVIISP